MQTLALSLLGLPLLQVEIWCPRLLLWRAAVSRSFSYLAFQLNKMGCTGPRATYELTLFKESVVE